MLREYEFTFVTKGDASEHERVKTIEGYEAILKRDGGAILKKSDWGVKRLAYPIKKCFKGQYVVYNLATTPANVAECERLIRIDDGMLRHLVVKVKDTVDIESRKAELAKADEMPKQLDA